MLEQLIRDKVKLALQEKDEITKNILRVVIGEIDTLNGRGKQVDDEQIHKILRKLVLSNEETIAAMTKTLVQENNILNEFLPKLLDKKEILNHLLAFIEQIKLAKNDGLAIGIAMGVFKKINLPVDGKDVSDVVTKIRSLEDILEIKNVVCPSEK